MATITSKDGLSEVQRPVVHSIGPVSSRRESTENVNVTPPAYTAVPSPQLQEKPSSAGLNPLFPSFTSEDRPLSQFPQATESDRLQNEITLSPYAAPFPATSPSASMDTDTPACFSRTAPSHLQYYAFDPIYLVSKGKHLDKGFPLAAPPLENHSVHYLHPFISHDVTEADWHSFLQSIQLTATLNEKDIQRSQNVLLLSLIPFVSCAATVGIQRIMRSQRIKKVINLIEMWNRHFFIPRRIKVRLLRGNDVLSSSNEAEHGGSIPPQPKDQFYRLFVVCHEQVQSPFR